MSPGRPPALALGAGPALPGVIPGPATSFFAPAQVPDLIGVKDRRYLDHTGHARHRGAADLMRYAASVQGGR